MHRILAQDKLACRVIIVWSCLQVGHMVEKEARLALEQKELVEAQAALHTQVREA